MKVGFVNQLPSRLFRSRVARALLARVGGARTHVLSMV